MALLLLPGVVAVVTLGPAGASKKPAPFEPLATDTLVNAYKVTDKVWSGAAPDGEASFAALRDLGVKTILSVDGARPDVEAARRHGLRYVHLPIGYDEVSADEGKVLARAIDDLPGPVYLHCHHGKHRSAAAVAVACVINGRLRPEHAETVLKTFGTGENYQGLWASARAARPADPRELAAVNVNYRERAETPKLVDAMVSIDATFERLQLARKSGWSVPRTHPDLDPAHEALQLAEHLHELGRTDDARARPKRFRELLADSEQVARRLHDVLVRPGATHRAAVAPARAAEAAAFLQSAAASCTACHRSFRDERTIALR